MRRAAIIRGQALFSCARGIGNTSAVFASSREATVARMATWSCVEQMRVGEEVTGERCCYEGTRSCRRCRLSRRSPVRSSASRLPAGVRDRDPGDAPEMCLLRDDSVDAGLDCCEKCVPDVDVVAVPDLVGGQRPLEGVHLPGPLRLRKTVVTGVSVPAAAPHHRRRRPPVADVTGFVLCRREGAGVRGVDREWRVTAGDSTLTAGAVIQRRDEMGVFAVRTAIWVFRRLNDSSAGNAGTSIITGSLLARALRSLILLYICVLVQLLPSY